jgi:hypothetical protein
MATCSKSYEAGVKSSWFRMKASAADGQPLLLRHLVGQVEAKGCIEKSSQSDDWGGEGSGKNPGRRGPQHKGLWKNKWEAIGKAWSETQSKPGAQSSKDERDVQPQRQRRCNKNSPTQWGLVSKRWLQGQKMGWRSSLSRESKRHSYDY